MDKEFIIIINGEKMKCSVTGKVRRLNRDMTKIVAREKIKDMRPGDTIYIQRMK